MFTRIRNEKNYIILRIDERAMMKIKMKGKKNNERVNVNKN